MKKYSLFLFIFFFGFSGIIIGANTIFASDCSTSSTLYVGSVGNEVSCLQARLGVAVDGKFGPATRAAVIALQNNFGLNPDGVFGSRSSVALWGDNLRGRHYLCSPSSWWRNMDEGINKNNCLARHDEWLKIRD